MKNFEKKIFKDLYSSVNGLFAYTFYERYKLPPEDVFMFIGKYEKKEILIYNDGRITLTTKGKELILYKKLHFTKAKDKYSNIPSNFIQNKIQINEPYLPSVSRISGIIIKNH